MRFLTDHKDVACLIAFRKVEKLQRQVGTCYGYLREAFSRGEEFVELDRHFYEFNSE